MPCDREDIRLQSCEVLDQCASALFVAQCIVAETDYFGNSLKLTCISVITMLNPNYSAFRYVLISIKGETYDLNDHNRTIYRNRDGISMIFRPDSAKLNGDGIKSMKELPLNRSICFCSILVKSGGVGGKTFHHSRNMCEQRRTCQKSKSTRP